MYGPLGVVCLALALSNWKGLLPYIKKQADDNKEILLKQNEGNKEILLSVVDDARKERDYSRTLREREVERFLESSRLRDQAMKEALEGVAEAIREIHDRK